MKYYVYQMTRKDHEWKEVVCAKHMRHLSNRRVSTCKRVETIESENVECFECHNENSEAGQLLQDYEPATNLYDSPFDV